MLNGLHSLYVLLYYVILFFIMTDISLSYPDIRRRMIDDHKRRMYKMRFFSEKWQTIHQKRWDGTKGCNTNTCDCEKIYNEKRHVNEKEK